MTAVIEHPPASLKGLSDEQLLEQYRNGNYDAAIAEAKRRDRLDRAAKRRNAGRAEWYDMAHAQYLAAEAECKGNLVARNSPVANGWALWLGNEQWALKHASEELKNFWLDNPRITLSAYNEQVADGRRSIRHEMERDSYDAGMVEDGPGEILQEAEAHTNGTPANGGRRHRSESRGGPIGDVGSLGTHSREFLLNLRAALADSVQRYAA